VVVVGGYVLRLAEQGSEVKSIHPFLFNHEGPFVL
jgi:hypothetical protein